MEIAPNIYLVDKPIGITSHDAVTRVKQILGAKKAGHAGTLDPLATGLLIVAINEGTKELSNYVGLSKTYDAEILIGKRTDTGDITGEVLEEALVPPLTQQYVEDAVADLAGVHDLPVPAYAAVKVGGKKLYELARNGEEVPTVIRSMDVRHATYRGSMCSDNTCTVALTVSVASGVYVRSLAEYLGQILGYPATLSALRRTHIGSYSVEGAMSIDILHA